MQAFLIPLLSTAAIKMIIILWYTFSAGKSIKTWIDLAYLILRGSLYYQLLKTTKLLVYVIEFPYLTDLFLTVHAWNKCLLHQKCKCTHTICRLFCAFSLYVLLQSLRKPYVATSCWENIEFTSPSHASKHPNIFSDRIVTKALLRS